MVLAAMLASSAALGRDAGVCVQLETKLVQLERSRSSGSTASVSRYDDAIAKQRHMLATARSQAQRAGCGQQSGFLFFRPQRPPYCGDHDAIVARMEANLRALEGQRSAVMPIRAASTDRQRAQILASLGENNCGPQYARYAPRPGSGGFFGFFNRDYSRDPYAEQPLDHGMYGTFRTLCVRSCDGYFWPISFSTVSSHFDEDERICRASCPAAEVSLYVHRNPGETPENAVSLSGAAYAAMPNAFRHTRELVADCTCRAATQAAAISERVLVDIAGRNAGAAQPAQAAAGPQAPAIPLPRRPPGAVPPPVGSIATVTGFEDFASTSGATAHQATRDVRIVGPGFTLYRPGGG